MMLFQNYGGGAKPIAQWVDDVEIWDGRPTSTPTPTPDPTPAPTPDPTPAPTPSPEGQDTILLHVAEDAYQGDAKFFVTIDGKQVGTEQTVTALHSNGDWQDIALTGDFGSGTHQVGITFTNDLSGGTKATDRNLYVDWVELNGQHVQAETGTVDAGRGEVRSNEAMIWANGSLTLSADGGNTIHAATALNAATPTDAINTVQVGTAAADLASTSSHDMFVFGKAAAHDDVITGFQTGEDMLDLRGAVADAGYTGKDAVADHVLNIAQAGADAVVAIDPDGTGPGAGHVLATLAGVDASQLHAGSDYFWQ
jgi:hypothetical protein